LRYLMKNFLKYFRHRCCRTRLGLIILILLAGCADKPPVAYQALTTAVVHGDFPRSVAVLPFNDHTDTNGIAELVRTSFYGHLSCLPYRDVELQSIDNLLRRHNLDTRKKLYDIPVTKLGRILGCDALVYGDVTEFQRVFAGIYSSMNLGAGIQIWDARTGRKLWSDEYTSQCREGGVPLTLIDLPLLTVRSGLNLADTTKIRTADELTRRLVNRIPVPGSASLNRTTRQYELQIAAFSEKARAAGLLDKLNRKDFPAFIRQQTDAGGSIWYRVLIGPYRNQEHALTVKRRIDALFGANCFVSTKKL